jgi:hypothetical protein
MSASRRPTTKASIATDMCLYARKKKQVGTLMGSSATVYVSGQCPNCDRFLKTLRRLQLKVKVVNVDQTHVNGLSAVPAVVDQGIAMTGTKAFEWLQSFESQVPLEAYATVLGEGSAGLTYTDLETDETVDAAPFTPF